MFSRWSSTADFNLSKGTFRRRDLPHPRTVSTARKIPSSRKRLCGRSLCFTASHWVSKSSSTCYLFVIRTSNRQWSANAPISGAYHDLQSKSILSSSDAANLPRQPFAHPSLLLVGFEDEIVGVAFGQHAFPGLCGPPRRTGGIGSNQRCRRSSRRKLPPPRCTNHGRRRS